MTVLLSLMGALFVSTSQPVSADELQTKTVESAKSESAKATKSAKHEGDKAAKTAKHEGDKAAKKLSPSERESELHASTMKKYQAKKEKALAAGNEKQAANIDKQISEENARHEKRAKQIADKAAREAKTETKKTGASVEKHGQTKAPHEADAPKAPSPTPMPN